MDFNQKITLKRNSKERFKFDLIIEDFNNLSGKYYAVDFTIFVYPYSSSIDADRFSFQPFEEYAEDVNRGNKSSYHLIRESTGKFFGLGLGILIVVIFGFVNPSLLISIESIVSIFAAYTIGKELWGDLEDGLLDLTEKWPISLRENLHYLEREDFGTIQRFYQYARRKRYGFHSILPSKIGFVSHSNSKTVELSFKKKDLSVTKSGKTRIMSINFNPSDLDVIDKNGFLFGVKINLINKFLFFKMHNEFYQSADFESIGIIGNDEKWIANAILYKKSLTIGRVRFFPVKKFIDKTEFIKIAA